MKLMEPDSIGTYTDINSLILPKETALIEKLTLG